MPLDTMLAGVCIGFIVFLIMVMLFYLTVPRKTDKNYYDEYP